MRESPAQEPWRGAVRRRKPEQSTSPGYSDRLRETRRRESIDHRATRPAAKAPARLRNGRPAGDGLGEPPLAATRLETPLLHQVHQCGCIECRRQSSHRRLAGKPAAVCNFLSGAAQRIDYIESAAIALGAEHDLRTIGREVRHPVGGLLVGSGGSTAARRSAARRG